MNGIRSGSGGETGGGLCESCRNARVVTAKNGARYFLCRLSATDPRFFRYPRTPVLQCAGHAPRH